MCGNSTSPKWNKFACRGTACCARHFERSEKSLFAIVRTRTEEQLKMQPFSTHTGMVAPLDRVNVDTDQMVPKQFLKALTREGFGRVLFYDWRYLPGEKPNPEFVLNFPRYRGASVLLARTNFGCGSSREHAPWGVKD